MYVVVIPVRSHLAQVPWFKPVGSRLPVWLKPVWPKLFMPMRVWIVGTGGAPGARQARAPLDVEDSDTIENVKQLIVIQFWLSTGLAPGGPFSLLYQGVQLLGETTLEELGIRGGSEILIRADEEYTPVD